MSDMCKCSIVTSKDRLHWAIDYCPLHSASAELLSKLKQTLACIEGAHEVIGDMEGMRKIIAKAEGRSNG